MKRRLAALMAVIITASQVLPCAVYAEEDIPAEAPVAVSEPVSEKDTTSEEEKMKAALTLVKSRINIPDEYSNFSYSSGETNGMRQFTFTWKDPSGNESYSVNVTGEMITRYISPDRELYNSKPSFAAHDSDYYVNNAMNWLCRANPSMKGFLKKSSVSLSINSGTVSVSFHRQFKDIQVNGNSLYVTLNKQTGEVVSYYGSWWQNAEFEDPTDVLSQEAIKEIYCREVTIKPWYRIYTDKETGKKKTNIVYTPLNSYTYNALTGEHTSMNEDYDKFMDTDRYATPASSEYEDAVEEECEAVDAGAGVDIPATGVSLSEEELAAAADLSTMLTSAQFRELLLKDPYMGITDKYIADNFRIERNENAECGYSIQCNMLINNKTEYRNVNVTADAKSGKIMNFYSYENEPEKATNINVKKANTLANKALKYYFGDIAGEYRADTENTAPLSTNGKYKITTREMRYNRYVNNIQVTNNSILIGVNSAGKVTSVSCSHDKDVDFGDGLIVNKETALKLVCEQQDMTLAYEGFTDLSSVPHTYLHYSMENWYLNAVNGKLSNYNGEPIVKTAGENGCPYTDIAASPYKNEIETLYLHGVKIYSGDKFSPNEKMTYGELMTLLGIITGYGYEPMPLAERKAENGSVPTVKDCFTRMELAKEFTRAARVDSCAKYTGIFKSPFTDIKDTDKDLGYAALAYGMGAISCGKDGKFYPNAYVTREYAFHCAYSYLKNNSES